MICGPRQFFCVVQLYWPCAGFFSRLCALDEFNCDRLVFEWPKTINVNYQFTTTNWRRTAAAARLSNVRTLLVGLWTDESFKIDGTWHLNMNTRDYWIDWTSILRRFFELNTFLLAAETQGNVEETKKTQQIQLRNRTIQLNDSIERFKWIGVFSRQFLMAIIRFVWRWLSLSSIKYSINFYRWSIFMDFIQFFYWYLTCNDSVSITAWVERMRSS